MQFTLLLLPTPCTCIVNKYLLTNTNLHTLLLMHIIWICEAAGKNYKWSSLIISFYVKEYCSGKIVKTIFIIFGGEFRLVKTILSVFLQTQKPMYSNPERVCAWLSVHIIA